MTPYPSAAPEGSHCARSTGVRQLITLAVVFMLAASACSEGGGKAPLKPGSKPFSSPSSVAWTGCGPAFQCGAVTVPLDYSNPTGDTIKIAIIRKAATDQPARIGSVLFNPGGPGLSGVEFLQARASRMANLNKRFDLVSFDRRGVGQSAPVRCLSGPQMDNFTALDTVLDDAQEKQALMQAARAFADGCRQKSGKMLPFVDTASTARDMDLIRAALGDAKLTYSGLSYGTFLGETYAQMFPTHVRALALDAVVDPALSPTDEVLQSSAASEINLQAFLAYCSAYGSCQSGTSGDPAAKLSALMQRLDDKPMPVGKRTLTRTLAMTGVLGSLNNPRDWSQLDSALRAADQGNGQLLLALADLANGRRADGSYKNFLEASAAITCLDQPAPSDLAPSNISSYDQLGPALANTSAISAPVRQYLACSDWPVKPKGAMGPLSAAGVPPILLVGGTVDNITPYSWAQGVNKQLAGSVLLTRKGYGHVSYDKSECVKQAVDAYLIDLTLPAPGTVCESDLP